MNSRKYGLSLIIHQAVFLLKNLMFYLFIFKPFYLSSSLNTVSMCALCDVCVCVYVRTSVHLLMADLIVNGLQAEVYLR